MDGRAADGSATMQMLVSLGEERPGTVVEKHIGLGHPNVHLRETTTDLLGSLQSLVCVSPSSAVLNDKRRGEVKCERLQSRTATSRTNMCKVDVIIDD